MCIDMSAGFWSQPGVSKDVHRPLPEGVCVCVCVCVQNCIILIVLLSSSKGDPWLHYGGQRESSGEL